ncbi:hypothetical protein RA307_15170 [Xanthobacteraceae bacterium Astr-EGSB]|uniref:hypothetical protein n=1 Tax=Astrobacterium formosum TaxID=3069710 RepID=UPI0027B5EC2D|nr:hypothetical protein [Xanthobacteraceae bacterium Astr-EGSB]
MSRTNADEIDKIKMTITPKRERYLRSIHRRLREAAKTAFGPEHGRFDFYGYLELVIKTYWSWKDKNARTKYGRQFGALFGIPPRKGRSSLHYLIGATSHGEEPMHSAAAKKIETRDNRWVQGLRFVAKKRSAVEKQGLEAFCNSQGGIAGCERKSKGKPSKKRSNRPSKIVKIRRGTLVAGSTK